MPKKTLSYTDDVNKAFLTFCIEAVLLRMGKPQYEKVISKLEKDYNSDVHNCDKNPEFLKKTLQDIFGDAYADILNEIKSEFGEFTSKKYCSDFLNVMER